MHAWHWKAYVLKSGERPALKIRHLQNDMVEYNACQATLKTLYELGIPGKVEEFTAYRILMLLHGLNMTGSFCYPKPSVYRATDTWRQN